jgi:hypothetical protein
MHICLWVTGLYHKVIGKGPDVNFIVCKSGYGPYEITDVNGINKFMECISHPNGMVLEFNNSTYSGGPRVATLLCPYPGEYFNRFGSKIMVDTAALSNDKDIINGQIKFCAQYWSLSTPDKIPVAYLDDTSKVSLLRAVSAGIQKTLLIR